MPVLEAFGIRYGSTGFDRIHRQQNALTRAARNLTGATNDSSKSMNRFSQTLERAFGGITLSFLLHRFVNLTDSFINMQNRLNVTAGSVDEMTRNMGALAEIANKTRTELTTNVEVFSRFALAGKAQGFTMDQLLVATESLAKATVISGATTSEAKGAFIQLSQAFGSTQLRGQELTSVLEQIPRAAQAIAESLDIPIGKLREYGMEGRITSNDVLRALIESSEKLEQEFSKTTSTFAQALVQFQNNLRIYIGTAGEAGGVTSSLVSAMNFLSNIAVPYTGKEIAKLSTVFEDLFSAVDKIWGVFVNVAASLTNSVVTPFEAIASAVGKLAFGLKNLAASTDLSSLSLALTGGDLSGQRDQYLGAIDYQIRRLSSTQHSKILQDNLVFINQLFDQGLIPLNEYVNGLRKLEEQFGAISVAPAIEQVRNFGEEIKTLQNQQESFSGVTGTLAQTLVGYLDDGNLFIRNVTKAAFALTDALTGGKGTEAIQAYRDFTAEMYNGAEAAEEQADGMANFLRATGQLSALNRYNAKMGAINNARKEVQEGLQALAPVLRATNQELIESAAKGLQKYIDGMDRAAKFTRELANARLDLKLALETFDQEGFENQFGINPGPILAPDALGPGGNFRKVSSRVPGMSAIDKQIVRQEAEAAYGSIVNTISDAIGKVNEDFGLSQAKKELTDDLTEFVNSPREVRMALNPELNKMLEDMGVDQFTDTVIRSLTVGVKEMEKLADRVADIVFDLDPFAGANYEIQEQVGVLTKALHGGVDGLVEYGITTEQVGSALTALAKKAQDPLGKIAELDVKIKEYADSAMTDAERASKELAQQLADVALHARLSGASLTDFTNPTTISALELMAKLVRNAAESLNPELYEMRDDFLGLAPNRIAELNQQLDNGNALLEAGVITWGQYSASANAARMELDELSTSFESGARRALQGLADEYNNGAAQIEGTIVNAFRGAEDALVEFVQTGKLNFTDLVDSMIADLARLAIQRAILEPIIGFITNSVFPGAGTVGSTIAGSVASQATSGIASYQAPITLAPQVNVTVNAQGATAPAEAIGQQTADAVNKAVDAATRSIVRDEIQRMTRPGNQLNNRMREGV